MDEKEDGLVEPAWPGPVGEVASGYAVLGTTEAVGALLGDVGRVQRELGSLGRTRTGQVGRSPFKYVPLADMVAGVHGAVGRLGVDVTCVQPMSADHRATRITLTVAGSGAVLTTTITAPPPRAPTDEERERGVMGRAFQEFGQITTYLRRYQYASFWAIDGVEDLDSPDPAPGPQRATRPAKPEAAAAAARPPSLGELKRQVAEVAAKKGVDLLSLPELIGSEKGLTQLDSDDLVSVLEALNDRPN